MVWKRFVTQSSNKFIVQGPRYKISEAFNIECTTLYGSLKIINITTNDVGWFLFEAGSDVMSNRAYLNVITAPGTITVVILECNVYCFIAVA